MTSRTERGSASAWALMITAGAFTLLLGLVVDGGSVLEARTAASRAAAQAARAGADELSSVSVRNGGEAINAQAARVRAESYLHGVGLRGTVQVEARTVTVTVLDRSETQILGFIGIDSFPVRESETAQAISEEDAP